MGKGKKGEQIFNEDNDAVHETMALIQKEGMKPTKEEIDAMEAGGAGRGAEPTIKAPEAAAPAPKKEEGSGASAMMMVAFLFFAADIGKNVVESNVNGGFGKRMNTSFLAFVLAFVNLILAVTLTYVRQGNEGLSKLPDLEKIGNFAMPAVFFAMQASLMQLASIFLESGSMRKVLGQMRIPFTMIFSGMIMGATYTGLQKMAVGMILCSVWMFIVVVGGGKTVIGSMDGEFMIGLIIMILANLSAVFGTLVSEKFLKKGAKTSFYIQMFWIQITQVAISFVMYIFFTPYVLGYTFKFLLPVLGQSSKADIVRTGQNPFALKSNLMLAKAGYPFGDMIKDNGNTAKLAAQAEVRAASFKVMRIELLEKLTVMSKTPFAKVEAGKENEAGDVKKVDEALAAFKDVAKLEKDGAKLKKDDNAGKADNKAKLTVAKTDLLAKKAACAKIANFNLSSYTGEDRLNKLLTTSKAQKQALRSAMVAKSNVALEVASKATDAELFLAMVAGMIKPSAEKDDKGKTIYEMKSGFEMIDNTKNSVVCKVFGGLYVEAIAKLTSMSAADAKFMTSYPFERKTQKQQPEDLVNNFVLSTGEYFEKEEAHFGEALHGAVFSKKGDNFETEKISISKSKGVKYHAKEDAKKSSAPVDAGKAVTLTSLKNDAGTAIAKVQFQAVGTEIKYKKFYVNDIEEDEADGDWSTLMKCDAEDADKEKSKLQEAAKANTFEKEDAKWVDFTKFDKSANVFIKNCHLVADISGTEPAPIVAHVTQQPGKFGAGTRTKDAVVCDHRCHSDLIDQSDYAQFGWWTNYNQKLVNDYDVARDGDVAAEADASKFAFIPSWALFTNFGNYTCHPLSGFFDTWLLWLAAIANIAATWMSALVTKVLSSLHKQIISAVCLAAINFIEFYCIWEPSKTSKIATDNFYTGVLGVILSALIYSQAPKAPKKVEAKKD